MSIFFREGDAVKAKIYTIFAIMLLIFSCYGLYIDFIPSDKSMAYWVYSIPATFTLMLPLYIDKYPSNKIKTRPFISHLLLYFIFLMMVSFIFVYSIPAIIVHNYGNSFVSTGKVMEKKSVKFSKSCKNSLNVQDIWNDNYFYYLCVRRTFIESIKKNDYIFLYGKENDYGRYISSYKKANKSFQPTANTAR